MLTIESNNLNQLRSWGWDDHWSDQAAHLSTDHKQPGRIRGQNSDLWMVETAQGTQQTRKPSSKRSEYAPVVGDWVIVEPGPTETDPWSIQEILPRRSYLSRGAAGDGRSEQILAANIDRIWIVQGLDTGLNLRRLERYLAVAWDSGAIPEIILTKTDLEPNLDQVAADISIIAAGVDVRYVNNFDVENILELRESVAEGTTICLIGPSGVGKSTLVNSLSEAEVAEIGDVRAGDHKGRHTTTRRELFRIPGGACLIDTPGIRELRLWAMDDGLSHAFPEIEAIAVDCRFSDCKHGSEPGCAVVAAVESGELDEDRLHSYRKLQAEADYEKRKGDPRARAAKVSEWKSIRKSMKDHPKHKNRSR
ncbi:MAG: ribosome small subunit-dependent GTPase A [Candidatus Marinimicrobia bacterium]|nr:ribosome small subunit-dependent GTPase A [Candidatus Neomarinimicrobiota bacterium]MCF7850727.1 ribosome small subunit-dependent GTPase A [Candidatus Neomarinimicrobiota bacterium]